MGLLPLFMYTDPERNYAAKVAQEMKNNVEIARFFVYNKKELVEYQEGQQDGIKDCSL